MHTRLAASRGALFVLIVLTATLLACHKAKPPIARPQPPPVTTTDPGTRPPAPPQPVAEPTVVPPEPARDDAIASASLDDLNRNSPLKPLFFELDSAEVNAAGHAALDADAAVLKKDPSWSVTIEGHCD